MSCNKYTSFFLASRGFTEINMVNCNGCFKTKSE